MKNECDNEFVPNDDKFSQRKLNCLKRHLKAEIFGMHLDNHNRQVYRISQSYLERGNFGSVLGRYSLKKALKSFSSIGQRKLKLLPFVESRPSSLGLALTLE